MPVSFTIAGVHHLVLTVSAVQQSADFYTNHFGFQKVAEFGNGVGLHNGVLPLVLTPPPDPAQAIPEDRFDENRLGLDHVSLQVGSREELEAAAAYFDKQGVKLRPIMYRVVAATMHH
jgi:glyoxylase I family protein